jgi:hypothetical protein
MSMKNSNDTIGNQTRDLPVCSAVPQPTAPPRAQIGVIRFDDYYNLLISLSLITYSKKLK